MTTSVPPLETVTLRAGPCRLVFTAGELRHIRCGSHEVLRRICVAVRDRFWNTVPGHLSDLRAVESTEGGFEITFEMCHLDSEVDFAWRGVITGNAKGTITYRLRGQARRGFWRNRLGICVLHPIAECAGQPCRVTHSDGRVEEAAFPHEIAPHQPFTEIQAIAHQVAPGVWAEVRFAGDVFEMEDQRNWTDASFKTYSTPLRLPYPVWLEPGTVVEQSVTVTLDGRLPAQPREPVQDEVQIVIGQEASRPLPRLGLAIAADAPALSPVACELLSGLRLAHLRADLALDRPAWQAALEGAAAQSRLLDVPLELALTLSADAAAELERLASIGHALPKVWAWLIFGRGRHTTPAELVQAARPILRRLVPDALIGGGSDIYFAQLNRARPPAGLFELLSYPVTPQVHAEDDATLVESLAAQAETVRTARGFASGARIAVSPITLKPRRNPVALATGAAETPSPADPRQGSLLVAGWTTISCKYLAESGADSVTYFETIGPRGVMEASATPLVFPLYHVLADIGEFGGGEVIRCASSQPLQADALLLTAGGQRRLLVASFADQAQTVVVHGVFGNSPANVRVLDETNAGRVAWEPQSYRAEGQSVCLRPDGVLRLRLRPFAVAQVDWGC